MVSLTPYKNRLSNIKPTSYNSDNPRGDFLSYLSEYGFTPPKILKDGVIDRIDAPNDKPNEGNGWYVYYQYEEIAHATFGSWKGNPEKVNWTSRSKETMTPTQKMRMNEAIRQAEEQRRIEERERHERVAGQCFEKWSKLPDANESNAYIKRKQIIARDGVKSDGEKLIIPVTVDGNITSLQTIYPDGTKKFKAGGRTKGCYFVIKGSADIVYIAEGYATADSIHQATGATTYISFSAHNLYETTHKARAEYPNAQIILAGENNDTFKAKALQLSDYNCIYPNEGDDFNDLHVAKGLDFIRNELNKKPKAYNNTITQKGKYDGQFNGVMREIIDYYNATSGNEQPYFAIQSAIATCSILLARNFSTNFSNRASLFLMNIAKSGTGKEHAKKTMEKILDATGNGSLISGDGYTSGSAVISALQERPRHITVIDEFSKYLEAAQNKHGSSHLMEANTQLMQAIGRLDGTMRARSYATIGLSQGKKKELANQYVINPAITLMCMTTPDHLFKTLDVASIKDGFLNRFIICISDAERTLREHKEPIDVPQSIIEWADAIKERCGGMVETAMDEPKIIEIPFTIDAIYEQRKFQEYCIEQANELDLFGMDEIPNRSNEMAMRLALIIALSENYNVEKITEIHMKMAIDWIKFNLDRLIKKLKMSVSSSEHEAHKKEILQALRDRNENGITWSDMQKRAPFSKHKRRDLEEILVSLRDAELAIDSVHSEGRGRPTKLWIALN